MKVIDTTDKTYFPAVCHCPESYTDFNEDWMLGKDGQMVSTRSGYCIEPSELDMGHWLLHLMPKRWFDANTFIPAYFEACSRAGIDKVTIMVSY